MTFKSVLCAAAFCGLLAAPASAITLVNEDQQTYTVDVFVGEGDSTNEQFELEYDYAADEFCTEGCKIRLDNGEEMHFSGHELVSIRNGKFAIAQ